MTSPRAGGKARANQADPLVEFDRSNLWHPYSSIVDPAPVFQVTSAAGVRIRLADGRELIDGMASWWSAIHGYNHPVLNDAIKTQVDHMAHVMFGGLTHEPAIRLGRRLVDLTPAALETVFFADSGSVAIEVAIKMAIQFWAAREKPHRQRLLTISGGYHGDTFGAMAVCDPVTGMHTLFRDVLPEHYFAPRPRVRFNEPWHDEDISEFESLLAAHVDEVAAVILEPIVQGAGGMWFYCVEYLQRVRELCDQHDVLLIFDEIATGFGRTGKLFACEHADVAPDIMCLGKALTGGYMNLAATLTSRRVAATVCDGEPGVFMHGPTFMANPLACATALASVDLLLSTPWEAEIARIATQLHTELEPCRDMHQVVDVRVLGAIGVVELRTPVDMRRIPHAFVDRGVWIRPFGRLVYLMPPYIISNDDLSRLTTAIVEVVDTLE